MSERPEPGRRPWHGIAFGIPLLSRIALPGISPLQAPSDHPPTEILVVGRQEVHEHASSWARTVVFEGSVGVSAVRVEAGAHGFLFEHSFYGVFWVPVDGLQILCAPEPLVDWVWQRLLVGQLLPLVAVLRGLEPFHGSAVELENGAVILLGDSGMGKTSVMLALVRRGLPFLADDVTAVGAVDGQGRAFPGAAVASVAPHELRSGSGTVPWRELGNLDGETRVLMTRPATAPVAVAAVVSLGRTGESGSEIHVGPVGTSVPMLLGSTFNVFYRSPQRLTRQLEITSTVARSARLLQVSASEGASADDVAETLIEHLSGAAA